MKTSLKRRSKAVSLFTALLLLCVQSCNVPQKSPATQVAATRDIYAEHVRTSGYQTPEQERLSFKLPEGFEVTLFASEPDIIKPMNMEFDDRGRLWVTQSGEYPMAAGESDGRDRITILEDKNGDGKADTFTHFDDNLNIPIGIMPVSDGAIAYSIPNLYYFKDADQDGKADSKKVLLGAFGHKDTHGMVNNIMRGYDGWVHVCHGFSNTSTVAGTDGDSITMVSGNTFRVKMDGSRVEQTTFGRVNPFGYAYDEKGYLYSVDCHTKPITQLIAGGDYPHFGKKAPEGMGFAPEMMSYELGSTALAGLVYYTGKLFPEKYQKSFFTGDVVTCRIDRNTISFKGSTPVSKKEEPFLVSTDPWFRPVDVKLGPDGSLYIADFYNRIIGHYEVPLNHPGRDKVSGRIWKVTYKGTQGDKPMSVTDWSKADLQQLVDGLSHPQLNTRLKVADRIVDTWQNKAVGPMRSLLTSGKTKPIPYVHALWILHRLNALSDSDLNTALRHADATIKIHALRVLLETKDIKDAQIVLAAEALQSKDPFIQRTAAEILGKNLKAQHLAPLIHLYEATPQEDSHLRYTALLAIRNNLRNSRVMWRVPGLKWTDSQLAILTKVLLDVPSSAGAAFVLDYVLTHDIPAPQLTAKLEYIGRYASSHQMDQVVALLSSKFGDNYDTQLSLYNSFQKGIQQNGSHASPRMKDWALSLARHYLGNISENTDIWKSRPTVSTVESVGAWTVKDSILPGITPAFRLLLSERKGDAPREILYSIPFKLPAQLRMSVFDNDIYNSETKKGISKNVVRVRLAGNHKLLAERRLNQVDAAHLKDVLQNVTLDLTSFQGQLGYIEAVDSSRAGSIGIGNFEPRVLEIPSKSHSEISELRVLAAQIAGDYKDESLEPALTALARARWAESAIRVAAASALMSMDAAENNGTVGEIFGRHDEPSSLKEKLAVILGQASSSKIFALLQKGFSGSIFSVQTAIASVLSNSAEGINFLLQALKDEDVNANVLSDIRVRERLAANITPSQQKLLNALTADGAGEREERQKLIDTRTTGFQSKIYSAPAGKTIFVQHCSSCHQIGGSGGLIGPQLDGIGNWGKKALTEKILDPNRNISESFRSYNITLKNDRILTGLYRRTEGETMVFADPAGQEFSVLSRDMKDYKASKYTLMPDQFRNTLPEKDFYALMEYLTNVK
jgi:putative heme-binding domain-containing protein